MNKFLLGRTSVYPAFSYIKTWKEYSMKKKIKWFGLIALVAVIGFSMFGCDLNNDDDNGATTVPVTGVTLNPYSLNLVVGDTAPLTPTVQPADATNKSVSWSSTNPSVATVNNGTVRAVSAGQAVIIATTQDGNKTDACLVTVSTTQPQPNYTLDGVWENLVQGNRVTVSGSTGIRSAFVSNPNALTQDAITKGYTQIGDQVWRNLTSTSNLTWSGQQMNIQFYNSSPNVAIGTVYVDRTFTLSADGQTLTVEEGVTYTRIINYSLDGVWENLVQGNRVTVSGSTGIRSAFVSNPNALTQDAITKGYTKIGDQVWRNLTSTGNLTWSGQQMNIQFYNSSPNVAIGTVYVNRTFTLSADGQTLTVEEGVTYTRKQ